MIADVAGFRRAVRDRGARVPRGEATHLVGVGLCAANAVRSVIDTFRDALRLQELIHDAFIPPDDLLAGVHPHTLEQPD